MPNAGSRILDTPDIARADPQVDNLTVAAAFAGVEVAGLVEVLGARAEGDAAGGGLRARAGARLPPPSARPRRIGRRRPAPARAGIVADDSSSRSATSLVG